MDGGQRGGRVAVGFVLAATLAAVAHLLVGYVVLTTGLVAPVAAWLGLLLAWLVLGALLVRLVRRRSWWVLAVPVAAAALWLAVVSAGDAWLGWTA